MRLIEKKFKSSFCVNDSFSYHAALGKQDLPQVMRIGILTANCIVEQLQQVQNSADITILNAGGLSFFLFLSFGIHGPKLLFIKLKWRLTLTLWIDTELTGQLKTTLISGEHFCPIIRTFVS